ncbi:unnamed protein product [Rotaria sp. Silwood1]|nr:unnamed protein product [Rotaria sp. Silwood1]
MICLYHNVHSQALAEIYARIDAIFCKNFLTPIRAEEGILYRILGLCGKLYTTIDDSLGDEYPSMDENDLLAIDREDRAIMTEHELEDGTSLVVINVLLSSFILFLKVVSWLYGDFNVSHKLIDTCDPGEDLNYFNSSSSPYTCWETLSNARVNNYGIRIDYILCDGIISKLHLINCEHRIEIESSDHCPVIDEFNFILKDRSEKKSPSICTKFWPEFKGTQMKLNQFIVKTKRIRNEEITIDDDKKQQVDEITTTNKQVNIENTEVVSSSNIEPNEKSKKTITTWNQIFRPPTPPPPLCSGHKERCVIRQVKDTSSVNWGRYFYVCSRANGAPDNSQVRCDHF